MTTRDLARAVFADCCDTGDRLRTTQLNDAARTKNGNQPFVGNIAPWLFPTLIESDGTEVHTGSKLSRAGVYCSESEAAALAAVVRPALKRSIRDRFITMFCYCPDTEPGDVAVATRAGDGPQSSCHRFILFPAEIITRAAKSEDAAGLARGGAAHILPDALIETGLDAEGVRCQTDPEYGLAMAFAVRVAADVLVPDRDATKAGKAAARAERERRRRIYRLEPVIEALRLVGETVSVPGDSVGCAVELTVVCARHRRLGTNFPRTSRTSNAANIVYQDGGYWYDRVALTRFHTYNEHSRRVEDVRPNPDFVPPAGYSWGTYTYQPYQSTTETTPPPVEQLVDWVTESGERLTTPDGGHFTGQTAVTCWSRLVEYCDHYAARWLATGGRD